jgi:hypothetical protein
VLGQFRILFVYDVAEAIRLDALRSLLKPGTADPATTVPSQIPQYLKFERPPVVLFDRNLIAAGLFGRVQLAVRTIQQLAQFR